MWASSFPAMLAGLLAPVFVVCIACELVVAVVKQALGSDGGGSEL